MNAISDLGGMLGFGAVPREADEPVWHEEWEKVVFSIQYAALAQGLYNLDEVRHAQESMDPAVYLAAGYYERWLESAVQLLLAHGVLQEGEVERRAALLAAGGDPPVRERLDPQLVARLDHLFKHGHSDRRDGAAVPRFAAGDPVRTRNMHPRGHNRLPRYARGKLGTIDRVYGPFVFADTHAHGRGEQPQPLYCVVFDAHELWGEDAEGRQRVSLDLWESYLDPLIP